MEYLFDDESLTPGTKKHTKKHAAPAPHLEEPVIFTYEEPIFDEPLWEPTEEPTPNLDVPQDIAELDFLPPSYQSGGYGVETSHRKPAPGHHRAHHLLEGLNKQQHEAVIHQGKPLLIVAGAGSGKTRVLTHRIAYLLATGRAYESEILAITFTNKAAAEMRERIIELVGESARRMWISTFHSFCVRVLRKEASHLDMKTTFSIYDSADSLRLITTLAKNYAIDTQKIAPKAIASRISQLKNELITAYDFQTTMNPANPFDRAVSQVYNGYTQRLQAAHALDFDDLISKTVHLLRTVPEVAQYYRTRFKHILVDEYQDTNHAQYALVRELVGKNEAELTVVGDSDQSIYAFRGADIRNIIDFEQDYPSARTIMLEQNYRSTQNILSAANAVIEKNKDRRPKKLWTASGEGEKIVGYVAENEHGEGRYIAAEIDRLYESHGIRPGDVAIFYRTNAQSRILEEALMREGLPYRVVGGTRFYERKEIKDVLSYLRIMVNADDDVNTRRILNVPKRGIGAKSEGLVADYALRQNCSFMQALTQCSEISGLGAAAQKKIASFVQLIQDLSTLVQSSSPANCLEAVLEQSGYLQSLRESQDIQDESRVENLSALVEAVQDFEHDNPEASLADFLEHVALVADADQIPAAPENTDEQAASAQKIAEEVAQARAQGVITLMTLHTAKGLEFPVVFLTGMEYGIFPHQRAMTDEGEMSEERRLAYVGLTRARQKLYITRAQSRSLWGQSQMNPPSPFIEEIPEDLIEWARKGFNAVSTTSSHPRTEALGTGLHKSSGTGLREAARHVNVSRVQPRKEIPQLTVGEEVLHQSFGQGKVVALEGSGDKTVAKVRFGSEEKRLLLRYAPLKKL
ncbi:DNA helicase PcrA [Rothia sp. P13129]|uniref:DNA helicase PcrA n=1 Tax=Rothia sp. P13129 TaxID=3402664 RepID=UPI003ACB97DE